MKITIFHDKLSSADDVGQNCVYIFTAATSILGLEKSTILSPSAYANTVCWMVLVERRPRHFQVICCWQKNVDNIRHGGGIAASEDSIFMNFEQQWFRLEKRREESATAVGKSGGKIRVADCVITQMGMRQPADVVTGNKLNKTKRNG